MYALAAVARNPERVMPSSSAALSMSRSTRGAKVIFTRTGFSGWGSTGTSWYKVPSGTSISSSRQCASALALAAARLEGAGKGRAAIPPRPRASRWPRPVPLQRLPAACRRRCCNLPDPGRIRRTCRLPAAKTVRCSGEPYTPRIYGVGGGDPLPWINEVSGRFAFRCS